MLYLTEKKHLRRSFVAVILLLETILCFLIPLSLAVWLFINKLQNFNLDPTQLVKSAEHIANLIEQRTGYDVLDTSNIMSAVSILPKIGQVLMGGISGFAINVAVLVLILYFMLIGGRDMEEYVSEILPFNQRNKKNILHEFNMIVKSNAIGNSPACRDSRGCCHAGIFCIRGSESRVVGILVLFCHDYPNCRDCIDLGPVGVVYGNDGALGNGDRVGGLRTSRDLECR